MNELEIGDIIIAKWGSFSFTVIGKIFKISKDYGYTINGMSEITTDTLIHRGVDEKYLTYNIQSYDFKDEKDKELLQKYFELDVVGARKYKLKLLENL